MTTKLTLTIDDAVILSAKDYAQKSGKSLSSVVENYLKSLSEKQFNADEISPRVRKMMGVIKLPEDFDYKKELGNALTKKYLK
jgi:Family of unknown function (DUF6364)